MTSAGDDDGTNARSEALCEGIGHRGRRLPGGHHVEAFVRRKGLAVERTQEQRARIAGVECGVDDGAEVLPEFDERAQ
jgi:hypothetical protein